MSVSFKKGLSLGSLSLTPLIDVVFLMLIFFLVATRFEEEERQMDIQLPQASESRPMIDMPTQMFVNVTKEGKYYIDNQLLSRAELDKVLREARLVNRERQAVAIRADKTAEIRFAVEVMDACNKANIKRYWIATE